MPEKQKKTAASVILRQSLLLGLIIGALFGVLDVLRILNGGDLLSLHTVYLIVAVSLLAGLAGGLLCDVLILLLPRELGRFLTGLLSLILPNKKVEAVLISAALLALLLLLPLKNHLEQKRLNRELDEMVAASPSLPDRASGAQNASDRPNLILLVLDTVRADHLSLYGYHRRTTPHLERWAEQFQVFRQALSPAPWTVPSHATLLTGYYPYQHGARNFPIKNINRTERKNNVYGLATRFTTLAEILSENGYFCGAEVSNPYLSPKLGFNQGFSTFRYHMNRNYRLKLRCGGLLRLLAHDYWRAVFDVPQQTAQQLNRRIFDWLDRHKSGPFFLFANYMDAHMPYYAPPPFTDRFPGRQSTFRHNIPFEEAIMGGKRAIRPEERAHLHSQYDGAILYLDHELDLLLNRLQEMGLWRNSLIVITSDHGEFFGEHQLLEHNKDVYQPVLEIPLLIKYPGEQRRGKSDKRASLVDLMPTLLSALGLDPPPDLPGRDLSADPDDGPLLAENYYALLKDLKRVYGERFMRVRRALFHQGWKYIESSDHRDELYELSCDPTETRNLIRAQPERAAVYRDLIEKMVTEAAKGSAPREMDEDMNERLKALGYVE